MATFRRFSAAQLLGLVISGALFLLLAGCPCPEVVCPSGSVCGPGNCNPDPPLVSQFSASPETILCGQPTTLHWVAAGALDVTLSPDGGRVAPVGSITVTPAKTTTYTVTAQNPPRNDVRNLTITVIPVFSDLQILFNTSGNDKAADSQLTVNLAGEPVFQQSGLLAFASPSQKSIPLSPATMEQSKVSGKMLEVCITSPVKDVWGFRYELTGTAPDVTLKYSSGSIELTATSGTACTQARLP